MKEFFQGGGVKCYFPNVPFALISPLTLYIGNVP